MAALWIVWMTLSLCEALCYKPALFVLKMPSQFGFFCARQYNYTRTNLTLNSIDLIIRVLGIEFSISGLLLNVKYLI